MESTQRTTSSWCIFSDFDGTITKTDSIKFLLERYGRKEWVTVQEEITSGRLNEVVGLERLLNTLTVDLQTAVSLVLANVEVRSLSFRMLSEARRHKIPLFIISNQ